MSANTFCWIILLPVGLSPFHYSLCTGHSVSVAYIYCAVQWVGCRPFLYVSKKAASSWERTWLFCDTWGQLWAEKCLSVLPVSELMIGWTCWNHFLFNLWTLVCDVVDCCILFTLTVLLACIISKSALLQMLIDADSELLFQTVDVKEGCIQ